MADNSIFRNVQRRNLGQTGLPLTFQHSAASSLDLVKRLELKYILEGHTGCVNTVSFSEAGDLLVSGSDDKRIMLWNFYTGARKLTYKSGHHNNVFQARFLPYTNNSTVVTCAADGQVRVGYLRGEGGRVPTSLLATHGNRAHKLALEPGAPTCFYSCGEDGRVFHYDMRAPNARHSLLVCNKNVGATGGRPEKLQLHSLHCNPLRPWQFCIGGSDIFCRTYDQRRSLSATTADARSEPPSSAAAVADPVRSLAPRGLRSKMLQYRRGEMSCHVTCANFSRQGEIVATYNDENIYLFASEGPAVAAQAAGAAQPGSNLRKRGRRRGSSPPSVPGPQTSAPANAVGQEGRRTALRRFLSADGSAAEGAAQPQGTPDPMSASAQPMTTAAAENGSLPASAAAGPLLPSISEGAEVPEAHRSRMRGAAEAAFSHGRTPTPGGSPPCTGPGGGMDDEAACSSGQEAAAPHASDMQEETGIAEATSRPEVADPAAMLTGESSTGDESGTDITSEDEFDESDSGSGDIEGGYMLVQPDFNHDDDADDADESGDGMHVFGGVVVSSADREAFLNSQGDAGIAQDDLAGFDDEVVMKYTGHRNSRTVKGVSFLGESDEYVMSGSDDGHIYVWTKADGVLRQWLKGDSHVVNCLEPHPALPMTFATSGIEDDIKLWSPTAVDPQPIPQAAERVMERNRRDLGPHRPNASARRILLRLQHLAQAREQALQAAGWRPTEEGGPGAAQHVLAAHRRLREQVALDSDEEGEGHEADPRSNCVVS